MASLDHPFRSSVALRLSASLWTIGALLLLLGAILAGSLLWMKASYDRLFETRSEDVKLAAELATHVHQVAAGAFEFASILSVTLPNERDLRIQPAQDALNRIEAQFDLMDLDPALLSAFAASTETLMTRLRGLIERITISAQEKQDVDELTRTLHDRLDRLSDMMAAGGGSTISERWVRRVWASYAMGLQAEETPGPGQRARLRRQACTGLAQPEIVPVIRASGAAVPDPDAVRDLVRLVVELICGPDNLFDRVEAYLAAKRAVRGHSSQVRLASNQLSEVVLRLVQATDIRLHAEAARRHQALHGTVVVIAVITVSGLVLVVGVLVYLHRGVLVRFKQLHGLMERHVAGETPPVRVGGQDEISEMADAFRLFVEKRRNAEESLALSLDHLKERNDALLRLSGGIAHEVSNLLHPIKNYARLTTKLVGDDAKLVRYQETILSCVHHATEILRNVLYFAQGSARPIRAHRIDQLLESTVTFLRETMPESQHLICDIACKRFVTVNRDEFWQVLGNLVKNASDAVEGAGTVTVSVECLALGAQDAAAFGLSDGLYVVIRVRDQGMGMDEATQKRVFDPFFSTKKIGKGTGLGLSIVQGIVRRWNGGVTLSSRLGEGTLVSIALPVRSEVEDNAGGS